MDERRMRNAWAEMQHMRERARRERKLMEARDRAYMEAKRPEPFLEPHGLAWAADMRERGFVVFPRNEKRIEWANFKNMERNEIVRWEEDFAADQFKVQWRDQIMRIDRELMRDMRRDLDWAVARLQGSVQVATPCPPELQKELADALAVELDDMVRRASPEDRAQQVDATWREDRRSVRHFGRQPGWHLLWGMGGVVGLPLVKTPTNPTPLARRFQLALRCWRMASGVYGLHNIHLVNQDEDGALFRIASGMAPSRALLVRCPSMDKPHVLFVPRTMERAKQARAWTFGMTEEEFCPGAET